MKETLQTLRNEMLNTVEENILAFWLDNMQDNENGGFYGQMRGDGMLVKTANMSTNTTMRPAAAGSTTATAAGYAMMLLSKHRPRA